MSDNNSDASDSNDLKPRANQSMSCAPGFDPEEDESDGKEGVNPGLEEDESGDEDSGRSNDVTKSRLGGSK